MTEVIILLLLLVIALAANYFQRKKRKQRALQLEQESQMQIQAWEREHAGKKGHKQSSPTPVTRKSAAVAPASAEQTYGPHVPQDAVLRRHYLSHLRFLIETAHPEHPTDNTLHRHYDAMVDYELNDCLTNEGHIQALRRNYETLVHNIRSVIKDSQPCPTDSMLRRHYNASH